MAIERLIKISIAGPTVRPSNAAKGLRLLLCSAARLGLVLMMEVAMTHGSLACSLACALAVFDTKKLIQKSKNDMHFHFFE